MRAISIKQPWAELIALGRKRIESRRWKVDFRGPLLVVASTARQDDECRKDGLDPAKLPYGKAACVVDLVNVTGDDGGYEWHLRNPRRVAPVAITGRAAIFEVPDAKIRYEAREPTPPAKRPAPAPKSPTKATDTTVACEDVVLVVARAPERVAELAMWAADAAPECDVLVAFDAKRAKAALERLPRLIVTEAVLPKGSGLELVARARAHVFARGAKILLLADGIGTAGFQADVVAGANVGKAAFARAVRKLTK